MNGYGDAVTRMADLVLFAESVAGARGARLAPADLEAAFGATYSSSAWWSDVVDRAAAALVDPPPGMSGAGAMASAIAGQFSAELHGAAALIGMLAEDVARQGQAGCTVADVLRRAVQAFGEGSDS